MRKKATSDMENPSQPEVVETGLKPVSTEFNILNWFCRHIPLMAKGLFGLAALGGIGFLARGYFSGTKKTDAAAPGVSANATDERSIVTRESAGIAAKSEDLAGFIAETKIGVMNIEIPKNQAQVADKKNEKIDFGDAEKEIEEVVTPGVRRSLMQNNDASSQTSVGATAVNNLVVNGAIPDQLIQVGYSWSGSINMTALFGEQINITGFSQVNYQPFPDWLQAVPKLMSSSLLGFGANEITINGNWAYVAADEGLEIINISDSTNPILVGSLAGFQARGITVNGNFAYVATYDQGLKIIDISNSVNPVLIGGLPGFTAVGITVNDNLAYVATWFSQGLQIIDISNSTNPVLIGKLSGFDAGGITVNGNLAYVVADQGLEIININNSTNPVLIGSLSGFGGGGGIIVNGNLAYVTTWSGLKIIDVSNSSNPVAIGGLSGLGNRVVGEAVTGNLAYVTDVDQGLAIIDVSNNAKPVLIGSVSGFSAREIAVNGKFAYVATDQGWRIIDLSQWQLSGMPVQSKCFYQLAISAGIPYGDATKIFNIRTDNFPYVTGNIPSQSLNPGGSFFLPIKMTSIFSDPDQTDTLSLTINPHPAWMAFRINPCVIAKIYISYGGNGIAINGNLAYIATYGLEIIDIGNSANPVLIGSISGFNAREITVNGNLAYVATYCCDASPGLEIIDISNSTNPVLIGSLLGFNAGEVTVNGNLAYVASDQGLKIINISNSTNPILIGSLSGFEARGIIISGNLAYVAAANKGLKIINISNSTNPVLIGSLSEFYAWGITVKGKFAYIIASGQGLEIIDISNSTNPVLIGSLLLQSNAMGIIVSGKFAYIATSDQGLKIIDISQPNAPIIVGEANNIFPNSVAVQANKVYAVGNYLNILDITNYQFSGATSVSDAGNYEITVTATDSIGGSAQTSFTIRVEGGPRLSPNITIPPRIALVGQSANFFLDQGTFYDPNEDVITYSASLANGGKLPYFLSFNPSSATFSSIPTLWDKGNYMITIFASDRIVYPATPANFILAVQDPIADQTFIVGRNTSSLLPIPLDTTFNGRSLVYSIKPRNSARMPSWLYFDAANRRLFGAPNGTDVGTTSMQVTLNDGYGEAFFLFTLNAKLDTPPVLASMVSTQTAQADKLYQFILPSGTFIDDDGDPLSYSANLGGASWLKFDAGSQTFRGTPSGWSDAYPYVTRQYTITLTATDPSNAASTSMFELNLNGPSSWEILINASIAVLGVLGTTYGYTHKKYLLWDFFKKEKYRKPVELLMVGTSEFSHKIALPAEDIKSITVTLSSDQSDTKKMSLCLRKTLSFFPAATRDIKERVFPCGGVSAYLFPWLLYDSKTNTLKSIEGGPTEEFVGKDIKIQVRGTDNRIMEEFHIKVKSQLDDAADEEVRAVSSSKAKHKKDITELGKPLISMVASNS